MKALPEHIKAQCTPEIIKQMRAWLSDCSWPDIDSDEIATLPEEDIVRAVEFHFDGGLTSFLLSV